MTGSGDSEPDDDVVDAELVPWPSDEQLQHNAPSVACVEIRPGIHDRKDWELGELVAERFLLGFSGLTLSAYRRDLRIWAEWCAAMGVTPLSVQRHHVERYRGHLTGRGLAPATVARRLSTVAGMLRYAVDEGFLDASPMSGVRRPKVDHLPGGDALSREEILAAFAAAEPDARLFALCQLLCMTGMRISSALGLDISDLRREQDHQVAHFRAKGSRQGVAVLAQQVVAALERYLDGRTSGPVFLGPRGGRWDRSCAWRALRLLADQVSPDKPHAYHPHAWRASFATIALSQGVSLSDVQDALLHSDVRTTDLYRRNRRRLDRHPAPYLVKFLNG